MKKSELRDEIDRLTLRLNVLQERIVALESRMWVIPSPHYQPYYYPPVTTSSSCKDYEGLMP
jgi:hypothetical protein